MKKRRYRRGRGHGSVSRRLRYFERLEEDEEFREKVKEWGKEAYKRFKNKINKRCIDCGMLIHPKSVRCLSCHWKNIWKLRENEKK